MNTQKRNSKKGNSNNDLKKKDHIETHPKRLSEYIHCKNAIGGFQGNEEYSHLKLTDLGEH